MPLAQGSRRLAFWTVPVKAINVCAGAAGTQRGEHRDDAAVREHARQPLWGARVERLE